MSSDVFAVVADPTRRRILEAVVPGPRPVNDVVQDMGVSQPTVSKHLKVLREAGLVRVTAQGQRRLYTGELGPLSELTAWVAALQEASLDPVQAAAPEEAPIEVPEAREVVPAAEAERSEASPEGLAAADHASDGEASSAELAAEPLPAASRPDEGSEDLSSAPAPQGPADQDLQDPEGQTTRHGVDQAPQAAEDDAPQATGAQDQTEPEAADQASPETAVQEPERATRRRRDHHVDLTPLTTVPAPTGPVAETEEQSEDTAASEAGPAAAAEDDAMDSDAAVQSHDEDAVQEDPAHEEAAREETASDEGAPDLDPLKAPSAQERADAPSREERPEEQTDLEAPSEGTDADSEALSTELPESLDPVAARHRAESVEESNESGPRPSGFLANLFGRRRGR